MFWPWFIIVGIIGRWLAGKTTIPKLRKAAPLRLLQAFALIGLGSLALIGIFGVRPYVESWLFYFLTATLSWAGIVCLPELIKRVKISSNKGYYRELEKEIAESKTPVPRIRKPGQVFMAKTSFEFPLAPQEIPKPPVRELADILADSVAPPKPAKKTSLGPPAKNTILDIEQSQVRSELLSVLLAHAKSKPESVAEQTVADVLAPAPRMPSLFSTPILETGPSGGGQGVSSRFGSKPAKTLDAPLPDADLVSTSSESGEASLGGFSYKPKLIESKFSKPIE